MLKQEHGFTLIEILLAMVIAAALIPIVFAGQHQVRARAQFTDSVERVKQTLTEVKNEANTTVSVKGCPSSCNTSKVVFGKLVEFQKGQSTITVTTLTCLTTGDDLDCKSGIDQLMKEVSDSYTVTIPWGATFQPVGPVGIKQSIVFVKQSTSGKLLIFTPLLGNFSTNPANYKTGVVSPALPLPIKNTADGFTATVTVDPSTLSITRTIN